MRLDDAAVTGQAVDALLSRIDSWGAEHAAAAVVGPGGLLAVHGPSGRSFRWASVTKPVTAWVTLIAADRGLIGLDEPAGPPGSTVRHLLAHASGLPFEGDAILARPGTRRIYSNPGFDALGALVAERSGVTFETALRDWILRPLGMAGAILVERPSQGLHGSLDDLVAFAGELLRPTLLQPDTARAAIRPAFPGLPGVVPGVGRFEDCAWGLGFELHDGKAPHWMGRRNSAEAFGHFGGAGTMLWIDPVAGLGLVVLTDREFGPWALDAWPALADDVVAVSSDRHDDYLSQPARHPHDQ